MKTMKTLALALICLVGVATSAEATMLTFTDTTLSPGNPITYTLDFSLASGSTYNAMFTIANALDTSPEWYAGSFLFKFASGSSPAEVISLSSPPGSWDVSDGTTNSGVQLLKGGGTFNTLRQNGFSGFYETFLDDTFIGDEFAKGILLTGTPGISTFTFDFTLTGGSVNLTSMPFKVRYYDGVLPSGKIKFNQLSTNLTTPIPEPGTLLLIGTGLVGLGAGARRRKKQ